MTVRVRFAPSPTGRLHVGGARTALFNQLYARHHGGAFLLRSEDTDQVRSSGASERAILDDLRWLGITWDEGPDTPDLPAGPYRQSERMHLYRAVADRLLAEGRAYLAWETSEELDALRDTAGQGFRYRRRVTTPDQVAAWRAEGRTPVVRLAVPERAWAFPDLILGEVVVPSDDVDDFVLVKADGYPTYHFAVVVDDHHMGVSHVLRAQEHLKNTARHLALYDALGWVPPEHGHMPLIFSMDGGKMSKRDKAKAARAGLGACARPVEEVARLAGRDPAELQRFLDGQTDDVGLAEAVAGALGLTLPEIEVVDFRRSGYLPEALVNFLALLGWSPGDDREVLSQAELVEAFDLARVGRTAARFDREKLSWLNGLYLRELPLERVVEATRAWCLEAAHPLAGQPERTLALAVQVFRSRSSTLAQLADQARVAWERPTGWGPEHLPEKVAQKHLHKGGGLAALRRALEVLEALEGWSTETVEAALEGLAQAELEGKLGRVAQPVRIALTGGPVSPPIGDTLALVGREESLARLRACLDFFGA